MTVKGSNVDVQNPENNQSSVMQSTHNYLTFAGLLFCFLLLFSSQTLGQISMAEVQEKHQKQLEKVASEAPELLVALAKDEVKGVSNYFKLGSDRMEKVGKEAFFLAIALNSVEVLNYLINNGLGASSFGGLESPLIHAIHHNSLESLEALFAQGINPYPQLSGGMTLLHYAGNCGKSEMLNTLIDLGFELNQTEEEKGNTTVHQVIERGFNDCLWVLLKRQANTELQNGVQTYPIHLAVQNDNMDAVKMLLGFGANPIVSDGEGYLPLHYAIQNRNEDLVQLLLDVMPNMGEEVSDVSTLKLAKKSKNKAIAKLVKSQKKKRKKLHAFATFIPPTCEESCSGYINVNPQNGKEPYAFEWSHNEQLSEQYAENLCGNIYQVVVSDAKRKKYTLNIPLQNVNLLQLEWVEETLPNAQTWVKANVKGGNPPYTFEWNDSAGARDRVLGAGQYNLQVSDLNNCVLSRSFKVGGKKMEAKDRTIPKISEESASKESENSEVTASTTETTMETENYSSASTSTFDFNLPMAEALTHFANEDVNVVVQSSRGTELGRYTIVDYLNRLNLLKKYEPRVLDTQKDDTGKIVLIRVSEQTK